ncbi:hypothetical protein Tco_1456022 [Tanacetum coccineum]
MEEDMNHLCKVSEGFTKIHDVIKKEVEKLLDAGLIYPISDSPWVSPVHCVPKKGGMTVITNDENELIPTRLVTGWRYSLQEGCSKSHEVELIASKKGIWTLMFETKKVLENLATDIFQDWKSSPDKFGEPRK